MCHLATRRAAVSVQIARRHWNLIRLALPAGRGRIHWSDRQILETHNPKVAGQIPPRNQKGHEAKPCGPFHFVQPQGSRSEPLPVARAGFEPFSGNHSASASMRAALPEPPPAT
jgi:hypothetical protein